MRSLVFLTMIFFYTNLFGQIRTDNNIPIDILKQLDKIGDRLPMLNFYESAFLNTIFKDASNDFDFANKKIGFIKNSAKSSKVDYFTMQKKHLANKKNPLDNGALYVFNETQKKESGGYDAAIVYWNKFVMPIDKVVKCLNK